MAVNTFIAIQEKPSTGLIHRYLMASLGKLESNNTLVSLGICYVARNNP